MPHRSESVTWDLLRRQLLLPTSPLGLLDPQLLLPLCACGRKAPCRTVQFRQTKKYRIRERKFQLDQRISRRIPATRSTMGPGCTGGRDAWLLPHLERQGVGWVSQVVCLPPKGRIHQDLENHSLSDLGKKCWPASRGLLVAPLRDSALFYKRLQLAGCHF